jgi:hypothetical protein
MKTRLIFGICFPLSIFLVSAQSPGPAPANPRPFPNIDTSYLGTRKGIVELGATRAPAPPLCH